MSDIRAKYQQRHDRILVPLATRLREHIQKFVEDVPRIDRIAARAKSVDRFVAKAEKLTENGTRKYSDPLSQIQDQIGARIILFYLNDVEKMVTLVNQYFTSIEEKEIVPDEDSKFGYVGRHFILFFPSELFDKRLPKDDAPEFFELQVKTLFQHAWAESNHDLAYKPDRPLTAEELRYVAFTAAQSWGADRIMNELFIKTVNS